MASSGNKQYYLRTVMPHCSRVYISPVPSTMGHPLQGTRIARQNSLNVQNVNDSYIQVLEKDFK